MDLPSAVVAQQSSSRQSASRDEENESNTKIGSYELLRGLLRPRDLGLRGYKHPKPTRTTGLSWAILYRTSSDATLTPPEPNYYCWADTLRSLLSIKGKSWKRRHVNLRYRWKKFGKSSLWEKFMVLSGATFYSKRHAATQSNRISDESHDTSVGSAVWCASHEQGPGRE